MGDLQAIFLGLLVILSFNVVIYMIAILRKPPKKKPRYIESFETDESSEEVLKAIAYFALHNNMDIEFFSKTENRITVGNKLSFWSGGLFFYPIYLTKKDNGRTLVEVGVKAKAGITGSAAFRDRIKVINGVKAAIFMFEHKKTTQNE